MTTPPVTIEREGAIATLVFNRPEQLNALDLPSAQAFAAACATLAQDPGVRAVVLRGEGRCFGAGGDLQGFAGADAAAHAGRPTWDSRCRRGPSTRCCCATCWPMR